MRSAGFFVSLSPVGLSFPRKQVIVMAHSNDEIKNAVSVLRDELLEADDLYYGFLASIESALQESIRSTNIRELAIEILDRIIGEFEYNGD